MRPLAQFPIGKRLVGGDAPVLFIAEAGVAHFGHMLLAQQLVCMAARAGADVFKIQIFDVDALISKSASHWKERLRPRNLSMDQVRELKMMCDELGMMFMATAHDESRINWLDELDVPAIKVGSGERNNPNFLRKLSALGKPMIISTGMYTERDILEAVDSCLSAGCDQISLLHCVTAYPTEDEDVNLRAMDRLKSIFPGPVGYSDHTPDDLAILSAVARGAKIVEKHITVLRDIPDAQDWRVSSDPVTLPKLISGVRRIEAMLGNGKKEPAKCESTGMEWALKSLVAAKPLAVGHVLTEGDIVAKRPGTGILPNRIEDLIGKRLKRRYDVDEIFSMSDIESKGRLNK